MGFFKNEKLWIGLTIVFAVMFIVSVFPKTSVSHDMDDMREEFITLKEWIIGEQISKGDYACCLEKPCTSCIEKTPDHGEGAKCSCLEDVMNGVHPCGECIGKIMEGHGNPFIAKYFAKAIAEKLGDEYLDELKSIISEKYDVSVEEQV